MNSIIVVLPKPEDGKSIRNLLSRHGYDVTAVCTQGSQVLNYIDMMNDGIIVSGYKFSDMYYFDLKNSLPEGFDMLLLASQRVCSECGSVGSKIHSDGAKSYDGGRSSSIYSEMQYGQRYIAD